MDWKKKKLLKSLWNGVYLENNKKRVFILWTVKKNRVSCIVHCTLGKVKKYSNFNTLFNVKKCSSYLEKFQSGIFSMLSLHAIKIVVFVVWMLSFPRVYCSYISLSRSILISAYDDYNQCIKYALNVRFVSPIARCLRLFPFRKDELFPLVVQ